MPALLLIGIPIAVMVLFFGIMSLPDDEPKGEMNDEMKMPEEPKLTKKTSKSKKKKR